MIDARTVATKKIREGDYLVGLTSKGEQAVKVAKVTTCRVVMENGSTFTRDGHVRKVLA